MQKRQLKQCKVKENIMRNPINPPRPRPRRPQSPPEPKPLPNRTPTNVVMGPRGPKKMKGGGTMNTKMSTKGGMKGGGMTKGYQKGGALKKPTADQKGLQKLPTKVRNDMGFMKAGGMATKGNTKGGAKKTTGKGKVRGAGIAKRGVRPAKMR